MKCLMPYGKESIEIELPPDLASKATILNAKHGQALIDPLSEICEKLEHPAGTRSLTSLAKEAGSACVVVSDITRPVPNKILIPPVLETLTRSGVSKDAITILIATGLHRTNNRDDMLELLGQEIVDGFNIISHDCWQDENLSPVCELEKGYSVKLNQQYLKADLKILTGLIEPHPVAGFSGGGKSVLPGVAGFDSMRLLHSFAMMDNPANSTGKIDGSLFRKYINKVCEIAGVSFLINVTINNKRQISGVFTGDFQQAFEQGVAEFSKTAVVLEESADFVIVSAGGYPLDAQAEQCGKGLHEASRVLKAGGNVLWIAECSKGLGCAQYKEILSRYNTAEKFRTHFSDPANFTLRQWVIQAHYRILEKAGQVHLFAPLLDDSDFNTLGVNKVTDLDKSIAERGASAQKIYLMTEGPYMFSRLKGNSI